MMQGLVPVSRKYMRAFFVHKIFRMQCFFPLQKIFIGFHGKINFSL